MSPQDIDRSDASILVGGGHRDCRVQRAGRTRAQGQSGLDLLLLGPLALIVLIAVLVHR